MVAGSEFGLGLAACVIASVCFGTQFVPIKNYDAGDGMFVQWVMACAIFLVGLVVNVFRSFPTFYPLAMLGGFLWATGNITAIPIINEIGIAIGILLWSFTNLAFGWASGRYGWFGLKEQVPESDLLNGFGLALSLISTLMFAFVKSRPTGRSESPIPEPKVISEYDDDDAPLLASSDNEVETEPGWITRILSSMRDQLRSGGNTKLIAMFVSLVAGCFYGLAFAPVIWIQDNVTESSKNGLDYVFAHYTGVFATSTAYLIIYCAYKQNRPFINSKTILPAFVGGVLWAIAQTAWFVANDKLTEAVSFPIITRFPGVVAAIWGVFYFREIRGRKDLSLLFWAILVTVVGGVLSGLSKIIKT